MEWLSQGITSPIGFSGASIFSGIKKKKKDLTMIASEKPCAYAGVFTKNIVKAAPVIWNQNRLKEKSPIYGVIINSGNANACTGVQGDLDAQTMARLLGEGLGVLESNILVASTGVIGKLLPMDIVEEGIKNLVPLKASTKAAGDDAAEGIMTTDTFPKMKTVSLMIDQKKVTISGMAKGSGMIHPNMGTMLSFITTDANIDQETLNICLKEVINDTYNMISVDGDTSTNDMVLVLANGMSECTQLTIGSPQYDAFKEAFYQLNEELAKLIIRDGEGATKFLEVTVKNMSSKAEARKMVHAIITSNLVKTAFFGEDANWGRILCALGYSGAMFDPSLVQVNYVSEAGEIVLLENGNPVLFDEEYALTILKEKDIQVIVDCNQGDESAKGWGCDLSYEYVKINGEYRS